MVQKYQSPIRVYKYPFELVMAAYELRFPTCEMIPIFVGSDTVKEETSEDGALHVIERRCRLNVEAPYLLKKISGVDYFVCIQRNSLDRRKRQLKIEAWNESFASRIIINELCLYSVHPENPEWTCFEQSASLEVKSFFGFENAVEKLAVKHYAANIKKGKEIIEHYINVLKDQGITKVEHWKDPNLVIGEKAEKMHNFADESSSASSLCSSSVGSNDVKGSCSSIISEQVEANGDDQPFDPKSPLDEMSLDQLRSWLATQEGEVPSDHILTNFLQSQRQCPNDVGAENDDVSYRLSLLRLINETTKRC
ncbi:SEC14-like protein 1 [Halotydeus destructor]|nr:SEC14-like protein 1 [Halotydeus destructor]